MSRKNNGSVRPFRDAKYLKGIKYFGRPELVFSRIIPLYFNYLLITRLKPDFDGNCGHGDRKWRPKYSRSVGSNFDTELS